MMCGCKKCMAICGWLFLVVGVLLLLKDVGVWMLWGIDGVTLLFLLMGVGALAKKSCPDCMAMEGKKK
ncbi:hypothetical protein J4207_01305 [Candidatus Woesearchaeota archaeon]|nr:hypothetical protein [Candidatus Woesearchaeota archaeon]